MGRLYRLEAVEREMRNMKDKKFFFFPLLGLLLGGCQGITEVSPETLTSVEQEVKMILHSERDLNDIITLKFEPKNTTNKDVEWSCEENSIFTLNDSMICAEEIGSAFVTATSVANRNLSTQIAIRVYDPNIKMYPVSIERGEGFTLTGLQKEYKEGEEVTFQVEVIDSKRKLDSVWLNEEVLTAKEDSTYQFLMPNQAVTISVHLKDIIAAERVTLEPESLTLTLGEVDQMMTAHVSPSDTTDVPSWSVIEGEDVITIAPNGNEVSVHAQKEGNAKIKVNYSENVFAECDVLVQAPSVIPATSAKYQIVYDLGTRKTAKQLTTADEIFQTFQLQGEEGILQSISQFEYIYGGGHGGRGETLWYVGNLLKFGTTSVNGSLTLSLNSPVSSIKITGYVADQNAILRVGDSGSSDWGGKADNQTTLFPCSSLPEVTKEVVEAGQVGTITIDCEATRNLKIATTNQKPLYITSIEFIK